MFRKLLTYFLLPVLVAVLYIATNLPRIYTYGLNNDELIYIRRTQLFEKYITGDFTSTIWQTWDAYDQPPVATYIYGLFLSDYAYQYGGYTSLLNQANLLGDYYPCQGNQIEIGKTAQHYDYWQCIDGKSPQEFPHELALARKLLYRTRTVATIATGITLGFIALTGILSIGTIGSLLAVIAIGWFSLFGHLGIMGMIDPLLFVWYSIGLLFLIKHKHHPLIGIFLGFAVSTKFNAGTLVIAYILTNIRQWKNILITGAISATIFIGLNPYLWSNPIKNTQIMVTSRTYAYQNQQKANPKLMLINTFDRIQAIKTNSTVIADRQFPYIHQDILFACLCVSFFAGIVAAIHSNSKTKAIVLLGTIELVALLLYIPLNWDRYFLPLFPTLFLICIHGLISLPQAIKSIWRYKWFILVGAISIMMIAHLPSLTVTEWIIVLFTTLLLLQGTISTIAMSYTFITNPSTHHSLLTTHFSPPITTFSLLIPAKHEANVIGDTIKAISRIDYPQDKFEALILIPASDYGTIIAANNALEQIQSPNIRVLQLDGDTNTKAYSLNLGLHFTRHQIIGIFDAEDEPQPAILNRINQEFVKYPHLQVIQAPVQLINLNSSWFSAINCLEYYFWFKSVLPFLSRFNTGLIAGNTVFINKQTIIDNDGWDESCLTEDADLGVKLDAKHTKIKFLYDETITTFEETPKNEIAFIKQRSRWDQGFLQVLTKGNWRSLPLVQKLLIIYTLIQPLFRHITIINMVIIPLVIHASPHQPHVLVAFYSWLPTYFVLVQLGLYVYGLNNLAKRYQLSLNPWRYALVLILFFPYQLMLSFGSFRAIVNSLKHQTVWDKTNHFNLHRLIA